MASVSWNDYNDSSSISSASSGLEQMVGKADSKIQQPKLNKMVSSPVPQSKANNQKSGRVAENLEKLSHHQESKVWLYVSENDRYKNAEIEDALANSAHIQKVSKARTGWHVFVPTDKASRMIEDGIFRKGMTLRCIYSTRNGEPSDPDRPRNYASPGGNRNGNRRYNGKEYTSPNSRQGPPATLKPKYSEAPERRRGEQKKKPKYVAKQQAPNEQKQEETRAEQKSKAQQKTEEKAVEKKQRESKQKKEDKECSSDTSEELKKMRQQMKKKGKKKGGKQKGFQDSNNPFSSLIE